MTTNACEATMCLTSTNLMDLFKFLKQHYKLYFSVENIPADQQVDYIMLKAGEEGLRRYNAQAFKIKDDWNNPEVILRNFEE